MKIQLIQHLNYADLQIEANNVKITGDLTIYKDGKYIIPNETIEQFITIANDCNRFNGTSDLDFVKSIYEAFLNDGERAEFLEIIGGNNNE